MTALDGALDNLVQGVSQQQPRDRRPGQCTDQVNVSADIVNGLRPRISTLYRASLFNSTTAPENFSFFSPSINGTRYRFIVENTTIRAFDESGSSITVNVDSDVDTSYISGGNMTGAVFDGQFFMANKNTIPALDTTRIPDLRQQDKIVQFLGGQYGRVYTLRVRVAGTDIIEYTYQTPDGSDQEHVHYITTQAISRVFFRALRAGAPDGTFIKPFQNTGANAGDPVTTGTYNRSWVDAAIGFDGAGLTDYTEASIGSTSFTSNFSVLWAEDTLLIYPDDADQFWDYEVAVSDGEAFSTVNIVGTEVTALSNLSRYAAPGMVTKVVGQGSDGGDFYMKFVLTSAGKLGTDDRVSGSSISGSPHTTATTDGTAGTPDNDQLYGTAGGSDVAYFNGDSTDFSFYVYPGKPDWLIVADNTGAEGIDVVASNIETLTFDDTSLTVATLLASSGIPPADLFDGEDVDFESGDPTADFGKPGIWVESTSPLENQGYDLDTMPLVITFESGSFEVRRGEWADRQAGGEDANPAPQFIGKAINYITVFQGRLIILAGQTFSASRTNEPYQFYRQSAALLLADDPIGLTTTATDEAIFEQAIQHDRDLVIFSARAQFVIDGGSALTSANASMVQTTAYDASLKAEPASAGANVLFATDLGQFTSVHEFFVEADTLSDQARPITAHVPRYILGSAIQLETSNNTSMLLVLTDTNDNFIYAYEYLWLGQEKVQSAWSKWELPYRPVHLSFENSTLFITMWTGTEYILASANLDRVDDSALGYELRLDLYETINTVTTSVVTSLPYAAVSDLFVVQGTGCPNPGSIAEIESEAAGTITLRDDMGSGTVYVGHKMTCSWQPTMPLIKDQAGVVIGTGDFTIENLYLNFADSGRILATISSPHRPDAQVEFDGFFLGSAEATIGSPGIATGRIAIPVYDAPALSTVTFSSVDPRPFYYLDLEFTGNMIKRGRRTTGGQ